jgi:hypothetical protein
MGYTDHGNIERASLGHFIQGGKDLLVRQIASGTEEDERVRGDPWL